MPVRYEAPGPASFGGVYGRGGRGSGGGGGGGGLDVVQLRDDTGRLQNQLAQQGLQGRIEADQIAQQGVVRAGLQMQAADNEAWLFQQRVTEQEAMQLRQDQNAISAIYADKTLSPTEREELVFQKRTGIDRVEQRMKRDLMEQQAASAKAMAQQRQADADAAVKAMKIGNMSGKDRFHFQPDPKASQAAADEVRLLKPGLEQTDPEAFGKEVFNKVAQQNAGTWWLYQPDGKYEAVKPDGSGKSAEGETKNRMAAYDAAVKEVNAKLSETRKNGSAVHPALGDPKAYAEAINDSFNRRMQAAAGGGPQKDEAKTREATGRLEADLKAVMDDPDLLPQQKQAAGGLAARARDIFAFYGSVEKMPPEAYEQYVRLKQRYDQVTKPLPRNEAGQSTLDWMARMKELTGG